MGSVMRIAIEDLPAELEATDARMRSAISYGARAGAERGRAFMVKHTPADLGQLKASWKVKTVPAPNVLGGDVTLAELINDAPHAAIVEFGARPHKVSAEGWQAIYEWARRHFRSESGRMRPRPRNTGPDRAFRGPDPVIASITWAIVRKIGKVGQKATFFVLNNLPALRGILAEEMAIQIERAQKSGGGR